MAYQPISNYGIIGDMNTVALVGSNGSIDFMCLPEFDSPSIFAALLDENKGGFFKIAPAFNKMKTMQMYLPDTNILLTRFLSEEGVCEITDFMPIDKERKGIIIRRVSAILRNIKLKLICAPRFNYAISNHTIEKKENSVFFKSKEMSLRLISNQNLMSDKSDVNFEFILNQGENAYFILEMANNDMYNINIEKFVDNEIYKTIEYWKKWISFSSYNGLWRDAVHRSALVLKLLSSKKYGSILAAPTFGLPDILGGKINWDYRYCWIRDASFSVNALLQLGYKKEVSAFIKWVEKVFEKIPSSRYFGTLYTIDGKEVQGEKILRNFEGYRKSSPVRIGNNAHKQVELDNYGELMDAVYLYNKYVEPITYDFWINLTEHIKWLQDNWDNKDGSIWELPKVQHFLFSRFMTWVAFDRIIKIGNSRSFPIPDNWLEFRDKIHNSIYKNFWNKDIKAFVQYEGSDKVDASSLLMPLIGFVSHNDSKWISTLKRIEKELISDFLVYRYTHKKEKYDSKKSDEGTFSMCTFWYIECLVNSGQLQKARFCFERMLGYANHLGLFAEELSPAGEHLGNFPQALSHLALINTALNIDKHFNDKRNSSKDSFTFYDELDEM